MSDRKVIGYLAQRSRTELYCDGSALVITGSETTLKKMLSIAGVKDPHLYTIRKARFGDILRAMRLGAAYSFDEEAYHRFAPLAEEQGIRGPNADFSPTHPDEIKLVTFAPSQSA